MHESLPLTQMLRRGWNWLVGFIRLVVRQYQDHNCQSSAGALTYVTLFATVPVMTVTYAMFSIIPAFQSLGDQLQELIFTHFLPSNEGEVSEYLKTFSQQARQLSAIGVIFLMVSAYLMLKNIEKTFNSIWGVARGRRGMSNFLLYWAILSLGPLLLGAALAMSAYLTSFRLIMGDSELLGILQWVFKILPWILTWAAFSLLFAAVPNCKVPVWHALIGGAITTVAFELLKWTFTLIVANSSFSFIYGAFAALPLFLLWVNIIWMIILAGAVITHSIKFYQIGLSDRRYPDVFAALLIIWELHQASLQGQGMSEWKILQLGLSSEQWKRISGSLVNAGVMTQSYQGDYVLSYNLSDITINDVAQALHKRDEMPKDERIAEFLPWFSQLKSTMKVLDDARNENWDISLQNLFTCNGRDEADEPKEITLS